MSQFLANNSFEPPLTLTTLIYCSTTVAILLKLKEYSSTKPATLTIKIIISAYTYTCVYTDGCMYRCVHTHTNIVDKSIQLGK